MATSSRSAERFKYGICLNDECPMCKQKKVQQIPMRKDLVCQNPECGKPLRECPTPKKSGVPVGLIIGIIAFLLVGGLAGGGIWAYKSGMLDKFLGKDKSEVSRPTKKETENKRNDSEKDTPDEPETSAPILIEELAIDTKDFTLTVGEKKTVTCTATPANNEETVTWKSSDESIATVDAETGEVKAIKPGSANIMAQTDQSGLSRSVMVTVKEKEKTPPIDTGNTHGRVNLSFGVYEGPRAHGQAHGFGGTIRVTSIYTIDLKKANGETVTVGPGDQIVSVKMENGRLRQGEIHFSDGTRKYISGL